MKASSCAYLLQLQQIQIRVQTLHERELHMRLKEALIDSQVDPTRGGHLIEGRKYVLRVSGHDVCPQLYAKLWGSSLSTLERISLDIQHPEASTVSHEANYLDGKRHHCLRLSFFARYSTTFSPEAMSFMR